MGMREQSGGVVIELPVLKPLLKPCETLSSSVKELQKKKKKKKMGKIPHAFRASKQPVTNLLKNPPSSLPQQSSSTPTLPQKPHHFPSSSNKPNKKLQALRKSKTLIPSQSSSPQNPNSIIFNSPNLSDAKKIFNSIISTSQSPLDLRFHNSLLKSFSNISTPQDSLSFLRYMTTKHPSFSPDRSTYHILLSQSCNSPSNPDIAAVRRTLDVMAADGFPPDHVSVDLAVRSLCAIGREEDAVELVKELSLTYSPPDSFTYNFLIRHLCKTRVLSTVYNVIDEIRNSVGLKPDLITYTILIDNVCNGKNLREAMRLIEVLGEEGFKPDCFLYNTIMKGYCMLDRGSEVIGVYKKMMEEGVEPDLVTYNTLIFGLSKAGRVEEAKKFLRVMANAGHFPDAVTYTSLMNGMCRKGDALGALELLGEMEEKGCSPNSCTYSTLLHGLCKSRLLEKGVELYEMMKSGGMKLDAASYATFIRTLCRDDRIAEAYEVFDYAVESKSLKDVVAYSTLENTLKWLKKVKERGQAC